MIVLLSSTSYPKDNNDWRGIFIRDMIAALCEKKIIKLHVWAPPGTIHPDVLYAANKNEAHWLKELMSQGGIAHLLRSNKLYGFFSALKLLYYLKKVYQRNPDIDVFHINWLQNALPLWFIKSNKKQPALITVLGTDMGLLSLPGMPFLLRKALKNQPTIIAPNAYWMEPKLTQLFGDISEVRPIPFGIKKSWYELQRSYNGEKKHIWLVVLRVTEKKIGCLFEWGKDFFQKKHELHLFGPNQATLEIPSWVHYHGSTTPDELSKHWFPKAAGLITLSEHDEGRPQVMLEAMASGLPIIASSIEAHKNFITNKKTGLIINSKEEFSEGINWLSNIDNNQKISSQAQKWVMKEIGTWEDCAQRYIKAYNQLLEQV